MVSESRRGVEPRAAPRAVRAARCDIEGWWRRTAAEAVLFGGKEVRLTAAVRHRDAVCASRSDNVVAIRLRVGDASTPGAHRNRDADEQRRDELERELLQHDLGRPRLLGEPE